MNNTLNRRVQTVYHHENPPADVASPISYCGNKVDPSKIIRCLRNVSPSSPALRYGNTSLKVVDDDVLVMDGVLVATGGTSSFPAGVSRKNELCRSWEDHGQCRHGSKCQFAHGKEEVRPASHLLKKKPEAFSLKTFNAECPPLSEIKCRFPLLPTNEGTIAINQNSISTDNTNDISSCLYSKTDYSDKKIISNIADSFKKIQIEDDAAKGNVRPGVVSPVTDFWSPLDDGIEATLPAHIGMHASRNEVNTRINNVLYGQRQGRSLPVFTELRRD